MITKITFSIISFHQIALIDQKIAGLAVDGRTDGGIFQFQRSFSTAAAAALTVASREAALVAYCSSRRVAHRLPARSGSHTRASFLAFSSRALSLARFAWACWSRASKGRGSMVKSKSPFFTSLAFPEVNSHDLALYLGLNLNRRKGLHIADGFEHQRHRFLFHPRHCHRRWRPRRHLGLTAAAASQREEERPNQEE